MLVAKIDKDYLFDPTDDSANRVGHEFVLSDSYARQELGIDSSSDKTKKVRFRCLDDDRIVYYGGWLINDDQLEVQSEVLRWTMRDAGCTTIQVRYRDTDHDEWVTEIG